MKYQLVLPALVGAVTAFSFKGRDIDLTPTMMGEPGLGVPNIQVYSDQEQFMGNRSSDNAKTTGARLVIHNNMDETIYVDGKAWADHARPHLHFTNVSPDSKDLSLPIAKGGFARIDNVHEHFKPYGTVSTRFAIKRGCKNNVCADDSPNGPPRRTLAEATWTGLDGPQSKQEFWYNLGHVDGFNIAMQFIFLNEPTPCKGVNMSDVDPRTYCPTPNLYEFKINGTSQYGCASDCTIYGTDEACCRGEYKENLNKDGKKCPASSQFFVEPYPELYSYAYDDGRASRVCFGENVDLLTNIGPPLDDERIWELREQFAK